MVTNGMQRWLSVKSRALFAVLCLVDSSKSLHGNPCFVVCLPRRLTTFSRAGHAAAWDEERDGMWIHGGYTTFYPYISSDGAGSGVGTTASRIPDFIQNPIYNSK